MSYAKLTIYTDGGARNNPGPAGIGCVFYDDKKNIVKEISEYIGEATNNQAEYKACLRAMEEAKKFGAEELDFYLDSELVVKQLKREYKVKNKELAPLFMKIYNLSQQFKKVTFKHVRREFNREADRLVNEAIDNR
ncbi:MAG: ribonuclease HI family protein [Patescibacteria group bacterium]|jgi:ribonuclease HI